MPEKVIYTIKTINNLEKSQYDYYIEERHRTDAKHNQCNNSTEQEQRKVKSQEQ